MDEVSKKELYKLYLDSFNGYFDIELLKDVYNKNYELVKDSYNDDDNDLRIEFYILSKLKHLAFLEIIKRVKEDGDINSEIYLIDKFRYVHNLYIRRNNKKEKEELYERAIERAIETYDGITSFTSYIYKEISNEYIKEEKKLKRVLKEE